MIANSIPKKETLTVIETNKVILESNSQKKSEEIDRVTNQKIELKDAKSFGIHITTIEINKIEREIERSHQPLTP